MQGKSKISISNTAALHLSIRSGFVKLFVVLNQAGKTRITSPVRNSSIKVTVHFVVNLMPLSAMQIRTRPNQLVSIVKKCLCIYHKRPIPSRYFEFKNKFQKDVNSQNIREKKNLESKELFFQQESLVIFNLCLYILISRTFLRIT
jgi:hypothetical protein